MVVFAAHKTSRCHECKYQGAYIPTQVYQMSPTVAEIDWICGSYQNSGHVSHMTRTYALGNEANVVSANFTGRTREMA